ncbi:hypothetical protein HELRODRAFT_175520 [Helobdella robusta]|uniref:Amine oxidase domain-containing protein n=1 Tax=Helobdella robusta TaxID=6412 RepID=T1F9C7_HELRO|nr:hypothetical protein HELRODRAFT_175520 [Helobdella robusta]ESO00558.1 hypothetical protein HELRODRAFT_175520 [Helobdella robusta]
MGNEEDSTKLIGRHKSVIIGGGIAGVKAGETFVRKGFNDFVILEASNKLGGRISSVVVEPSKVIVEFGANWIHGVDANPIFKIAKENNLLTSHYTGRGLGKKILFAKENGDPVHPRIVSDVDFLFGQLMSECEDFYRDQTPTPYEDDSVGAYIEREFEERISGYHGEDRQLRKNVLAQRLIGECTITGADSMREVALSEAGCFEDIPGVHFVIPSGFEMIIKILAKDIPKPNIHLNKLVTQISWDRSDATYPVMVQCLDGSKYMCETCLVTVPLGYLKKHAPRLFNPQLPSNKLGAIEGIGMGVVNKLILVYDGPVFPNDIFRLEMIWNREELAGEDEPEYLSPNRDLSKTWYKKIPFVEAIDQNILVCWISGKEAEYLETLTNEEVANKLSSVIQGFLSNIVKKMPKLVQCIKSSWKANPLILGAYCHIPVGTSAESILTLAEPVYNSRHKPVLFFAGEATHPTFYSSSHGAMMTGEKEADRILTHINDFTPNR